MSSALIVGILVAAGVYLVLQRGLVRITLGMILVGHAVNVLILTGGGLGNRGIPILEEAGADEATADPLPAALVLTAVVIGLGVVAFLLALAFRGRSVLGTDDTEEGERLLDLDEDDWEDGAA